MPFASSLALHFARKPGARETPIAIHGNRRNAQHLRGVFNAEATEIPQFDDTALSRIYGVQSFESFVERDYFGGLSVHQRLRVVKRQIHAATPALGGEVRLRMIHQDVA